MTTNWTEADIQALKAQEAKDLAVEFLHQLEAKDHAPITPGQVQLKELQFALRLREAEAEDNRLRESHVLRIKELELEIEREKARQAEAISHADRLRHEHAQLVEQVKQAQESLSDQLEKATREHNVKIESLESAYANRKAELDAERSFLEQQKSALLETIAELTELSDSAKEVASLRDEIESRKASQQRELDQLDEAFEAAQFEKNKSINQLKRDQEIELSELEASHRKQVSSGNMETALKTIGESDMVAVAKSDWEALRTQVNEKKALEESALAAVRKSTEEDLKRSYNITTADVFDVTELYYREKALTHEAGSTRQQLEKLESEITRMRHHIELEPERIARAVEAAKVQVQNTIEPARNR